MKNNWKAILALFLFAGCGKPASDTSPSPVFVASDPTILTDVYEREVWKDCSNAVVQDTIVRRAAVSQIKMNPVRNFGINSSSFFDLDLGSEFTPHLGMLGGPGGDNYKYVNYCQPPIVSGCDMAVQNGDNRIEYKYWSYQYKPCAGDPTAQCKYDFLEEDQVNTIHFTQTSVHSTKVCNRMPSQCPADPSIPMGPCTY